MTRAVAFSGYAATLRSDYDADVLHGFAEAGIARPMLGGTIEPFAGIAAYRVRNDGFAEAGDPTALTGRASRQTFTVSTLGLRAETPVLAGLSARSRIGWQHVLGDSRPTAAVHFTPGTVPFTITGATLSRDAAALSLDAVWSPNRNVAFAAGYSGVIGGRSDTSSLRLALSVGF